MKKSISNQDKNNYDKQNKKPLSKQIYVSEHWILSCKEKNIQLPIRIPGDNCSALLKARKLPDPYYSDNEKLWRWVGETDWQIYTQFSLKTEDLQVSELHLCLSFVDCFASIFVNDKKIGTCTNAFSSYRFNCKPHVQVGNNTLRVEFASPVNEALRRAKKLAYPMPNVYNYKNVPEIKHMNLLRKPQCHGGWDWGITLMVSGIYNPVYLESVEEGFMHSLCNTQKHTRTKDATTVQVDFCLHYEAIRDGKMEFTTCLVDSICDCGINCKGDCMDYGTGNCEGDCMDYGTGNCEGDCKEKCSYCFRKKEIFQLHKGSNKIYFSFSIDNAKLWWPAGYGEQNLYKLKVQDSEGHSIFQKIGLRELKLLNEKDDLGTSFEIRVNDTRVFCKGANWIPCDALPARQIEEKYRKLLQDAKKANMNMLRVWGGGQYERDCFYRICDEEGLLVWQDLMFACSLYPSESWFLDEVREELHYQIPRLQHHPCIVLWCGDNEIVGALSWYDEAKKSPQRYLANYVIFNKALAEICQSLDDSRKFWPSSPSDGSIDFDNSWQNDKSGDMHFWEVWHSGASFEHYKSVEPRFCSEFGFQSFPTIETIGTFTSPLHCNVSSPSMEHHQKNENGNSIITEMFLRYFRMPSKFASQVYLSQVQQALAISLAVEYWRSTMPTCLGTLYWQLNDNWPVTSWSSIDYSGNWKILHYVIARSYSPVLLTTRYEKEQDKLSLFAINDTRNTMDCTAQLRLYQLRLSHIENRNYIRRYGSAQSRLHKSQKQPYRCVYTKKIQAIIPASSSHNISKFSLKDMKSYKDCFCSVDYQVKVSGSKKIHSVGSKLQFFEKYKYYDLPLDKIHWSIQKISECKCVIKLSSKVPVFFLVLACSQIEGQYSDNCIHLLPSVFRSVQFMSTKPFDVKMFERYFTMTHLAESYY